jgi:hypothetical protein
MEITSELEPTLNFDSYKTARELSSKEKLLKDQLIINKVYLHIFF